MRNSGKDLNEDDYNWIEDNRISESFIAFILY